MKNLKVYDPDPEKSFTKAKVARLNQEQTEHNLPDIENVATNYLNKFPTTDSAFTNDFSLLPKFVPTDTLEHLKNCGKNTSRKSDDTFVEFASSKGLRLLPFVHDVQVTTDNSENHIIYLRALCWASYRKSVKYKIQMVVQKNSNPKILAAKCDKICPAGKSGCCCHVMAVIWKLDEISRKTTVQQVDNRSCTSKPRKWGIPGKRTVHHNPVMSQKLFKPRHASDTPGRKRRGVHPTLFDPRPSKWRKLDVESVGMLKQNLQRVNPAVPFSKMIPDVNDIVLIDTIVGKVAKGSLLHLQLKEIGTNIQPSVNGCSSNSLSSVSSCESEPTSSHSVERREDMGHHEVSVIQIISPAKQHPVSLHEINNRCERIKRNLFKTEEEIADIESKTRPQSACQEWYKHRFGRVTASNSYRVGCNHRADTSPTKIIKEVLNYNKAYQSQAMKNGLDNEHLVIEKYTEMMHHQGHTKVQVTKCGFFVEKEKGILGASPDGLITDPSKCNPYGIIEAKNVIVKDGETLKDALIRKSVCKMSDAGLKVNKSHMYFYQVQQQLFVVNRLWGVLAILGSNGEFFNEQISFEPEWWKEKLKNIETFYDKFIVYELAYPRLRDGLTRFDYF